VFDLPGRLFYTHSPAASMSAKPYCVSCLHFWPNLPAQFFQHSGRQFDSEVVEVFQKDARHRKDAVYLRTSHYVPPRWEAVRDAMPTLFDLLEREADPGVRSLLGQWLLGYIHPSSIPGREWPDGASRDERDACLRRLSLDCDSGRTSGCLPRRAGPRQHRSRHCAVRAIHR
jgi:hypothetical protein